jgi:hypothetical protein
MHRWSRFATAPVLAGIVLMVVPSRSHAAEQATPPSASEDLAQLRRDLDALRQEYGARMTAIESRISALEGARPGGAAQSTSPPTEVAQAAPPPEQAPPPATQPPPPEAGPAQAAGAPAPTAEVPPGAATEGGPTSLPVYGGGASSSKVFNPDIAAIGDFIGVAGKSPGGGEPSLEMHESELSFQAVVDPYARADFFLTFGPDEVGVEEAFITFPTLPGGFLTKVGKMRDAFGKIDSTHNHVLPFIDRPLVSKNLLGGEDALADAGISVARLIPNPWIFLEATGQVYQGNSNIFKAPTRGDLAYVGHLRAYQDLGESTNVDLGGSIAYGHNGVTADTTTRLLGVDATLRWRPLRRSIYTHLLLRGEVTWSRREQLPVTVDAVGGYGFLEYQFGRRWFAGVRYDNSERADVPGLRDTGGSFVLTYWPSEFSQVRGQYRHTSFGEGNKADEFLFQFIYAIGAHGAHPF